MVVQVAVGAIENVGLDVRLRADVNERDLNAVSVRVAAWIQLCVDVRIAVYVFVRAAENGGLEVGAELMSGSDLMSTSDSELMSLSVSKLMSLSKTLSEWWCKWLLVLQIS